MLMREARRASPFPVAWSHNPEPKGAFPLCEHLWCRAQYPVILANARMLKAPGAGEAEVRTVAELVSKHQASSPIPG